MNNKMEINCHDHFGENDTIADKRYDRDRIFLLWKIMKIHMQSGIKKYDHVNPSSRMTVIYLDTHNFTTAVVKEIASCMMLKVTMHSLRKFMNKVNFIRRAMVLALQVNSIILLGDHDPRGDLLPLVLEHSI